MTRNLEMDDGVELRPVDPSVWWACAGKLVKIPSVGALVYYFPQGHAEQCASPPAFSHRVMSRPLVCCRVDSVTLHANPSTDEVLSKIRLVPTIRNPGEVCNGGEGEGEGEGGDKVVLFSKVLTRTDVTSGGGGLYIPIGANSILPQLGLGEAMPLSVMDVNERAWEFRHVYRVNSKKHLITTGWGDFVKAKRLVEGDTVVFIKNNLSGQLHIGVRRVLSGNYLVGSGNERGESSNGGGGGAVTAEAVYMAAELAAAGQVFEVDYYPRPERENFVVNAEAVEKTQGVMWISGTRVARKCELEDLTRPPVWIGGKVSSVGVDAQWQGSPWKMLEITWEALKAGQSTEKVSPWQVEVVMPTEPLISIPPAKKCRVSLRHESSSVRT